MAAARRCRARGSVDFLDRGDPVCRRGVGSAARRRGDHRPRSLDPHRASGRCPELGPPHGQALALGTARLLADRGRSCRRRLSAGRGPPRLPRRPPGGGARVPLSPARDRPLHLAERRRRGAAAEGDVEQGLPRAALARGRHDLLGDLRRRSVAARQLRRRIQERQVARKKVAPAGATGEAG